MVHSQSRLSTVGAALALSFVSACVGAEASAATEAAEKLEAPTVTPVVYARVEVPSRTQRAIAATAFQEALDRAMTSVDARTGGCSPDSTPAAGMSEGATTAASSESLVGAIVSGAALRADSGWPDAAPEGDSTGSSVKVAETLGSLAAAWLPPSPARSVTREVWTHATVLVGPVFWTSDARALPDRGSALTGRLYVSGAAPAPPPVDSPSVFGAIEAFVADAERAPGTNGPRNTSVRALTRALEHHARQSDLILSAGPWWSATAARRGAPFASDMDAAVIIFP